MQAASPSYLAQVFEGDTADTRGARNMAVFSEQELQDLLGMMEGREGAELHRPDSAANLMLLGFHSEAANLASTHLQFQPHSPCGPEASEPTSANSLEHNNHAGSTSMDGRALSAGPGSSDQLASHLLPPGLPGHLPLPAPTPAPSFATSVSTAHAGAFPGFAFHQAPTPGLFQQPAPQFEHRSEHKAQPSHSSVEKQRRDRINALIDELRDLVPPQKGSAGQVAASKGDMSAEARRPKHVVLADTISMLRQFKLNTQNGALTPAASLQLAGSMTMPLKDEPESGRVEEPKEHRTSETSHASVMPLIPVSLSSFAGVTVERAANDNAVMYVQVKCRDRRGLLSDIINSLKILPVEIRTAAVVTCSDGMIRDVFEIRVDDPDLKPEEIQNVVHDGLYHQLTARMDGPGHPKKHRVQDL